METDVTLENHGSVWLIRPHTDVAHDWIEQNIDPEGWQWFGDAVACEPRYIVQIAEAMQVDGLGVSR